MRIVFPLCILILLSCLPALKDGREVASGTSGQALTLAAIINADSCAVDTMVQGFRWIQTFSAQGRPGNRYAAYINVHGDTTRHGQCSLWHDSGNLMLASTYLNGRLCGIQKTWWKNGVHESECGYVNGTPHGREVWWNDAGQMIILNTYVHGVLNGEYVRWYDNGFKKEEGFFKSGLQNGPAIYYFRTGGKKEEREYRDGKIVGRKVYSTRNEQFY